MSGARILKTDYAAASANHGGSQGSVNRLRSAAVILESLSDSFALRRIARNLNASAAMLNQAMRLESTESGDQNLAPDIRGRALESILWLVAEGDRLMAALVNADWRASITWRNIHDECENLRLI